MKMVKSLLLGSAAGLVAVAGAQAADLPVKAKPVQYVKICSLYGVGFYYIPGTDMCIKIGGWVRAEAAWGVNGSSTNVQNGDVNNRNTNNNWWRIRGYITADARDQTEYGTVRGYHRGWSEHQHDRRRWRIEPVQRKPRLHPVGGLHLRPRGSRSLTSSRRRPWGTWASPRTPIRVTADGKWLPILPSSEMASRPASRPKPAARHKSSARAASVSPGNRCERNCLAGGNFFIGGWASRPNVTAPNAGTINGGPGASAINTGRLRRLAGSRHRRQSARRPGLGFSPDRWCRASG